MKAPDKKDQCGCHQCLLDRTAFDGADVFMHCGTQAHYVNWKNGLDTEAQFKGNVDYLIRKALSFIKWPDTLKDYEYINFDVRLVGFKKPKKCSCELKILLKSGCQCGGK